MQCKDRIHIIILTAMVLVGISGCIPTPLPTSGKLEHVEGKYYEDKIGQAPAYILMFPEKRAIRRIIIYPDGPVKNLDVYVQEGEGVWDRIEEIKGRYESAITINTFKKTDAVRVVQRTVIQPERTRVVNIFPFREYESTSKAGVIREIEVFAVPINRKQGVAESFGEATDRQSSLINYALAKNGGQVRASDATHGHPPETVINGIIDPSKWLNGEGWECQFTIKESYRGERDQFGSAWIELLLPESREINRVVVHTYNSDVRYGLGEARLQGWQENRWRDLGIVERGIINYPVKRSPEEGRYEFTFMPIEMDKLRLLILEGDPKSMRYTQTAGLRLKEHWVRIMEIEVTGAETVESAASPGFLEAP